MKRPKSSSLIVPKINNQSAIGTNKPLSLFKHLDALLKAKTYIKQEEPKPHINKLNNQNSRKTKLTYDENNNLIKTYFGVYNKKAYVNNTEPITTKMKKSKFTNVPSYEEIQHKQRLKALGERIPQYGSLKDRKKKKFDPIANPVYFFRSPNDAKGIEEVELKKYYNKMKEIKIENSNENTMYKKYKDKDIHDFFRKTDMKEKINFLDLEKILENTEAGMKALEDIISKENKDEIDLTELKYKYDINPDFLLSNYKNMFHDKQEREIEEKEQKKELEEREKHRIESSRRFNKNTTGNSIINVNDDGTNKTDNKKGFGFQLEEQNNATCSMPTMNNLVNNDDKKINCSLSKETEAKSKLKVFFRPKTSKGNFTSKLKQTMTSKIDNMNTTYDANKKLIQNKKKNDSLYKNNDAYEKIRNLIPIYNAEDQTLNDFKDKIVKLIYSQRIYKEKDLALCFDLIKQANEHRVNIEDLEEIQEAIVKELNE